MSVLYVVVRRYVQTHLYAPCILYPIGFQMPALPCRSQKLWLSAQTSAKQTQAAGHCPRSNKQTQAALTKSRSHAAIGVLLRGLKNKPEFSDRTLSKSKLSEKKPKYLSNQRFILITIGVLLLHLMVYSMLQLNQTLETFNNMFKHTYTYCVCTHINFWKYIFKKLEMAYIF